MADGLHARPEGLLPASPPRRSLLDVPGVRVGGALLDGTDWLHGVAVEPEGCTAHLEFDDLTSVTTDYPYWWEVCDASDTAPEDAIASGVKGVGAPAENVVAEAFTIWRGYRCSSLDLHSPARLAEIEARLRRTLEACTPAAVEHELWTGQVAQAAGFPTPYLQELAAGDEIAGGAPLGFVTALAELEQALADCVCSGQHIIHAQPRVVAAWASRGLVRPSTDGRYLESVATGAYVVAGTGYPGTDPNESMGVGYGLSYAYGTGMVAVFLGQPMVPMGIGSADIESSTNTNVNTVTLRAERDALVIFDQCCVTGAAVSLCDEYCGAAS